jgi:hypothetical protein
LINFLAERAEPLAAQLLRAAKTSYTAGTLGEMPLNFSENYGRKLMTKEYKI